MNRESHQKNTGRPAEDKPRLAVIDDEDRWLKVFKRMFRKSDYHLETYSDPNAFLRVIGHDPNRFAGVICDIKMPEINGHQVFDALKENPATANIPFVLVSGVLTENHNLSRVQGKAYVSKLDDNLCSRIFDELIEVIENRPHLEAYLRNRQVATENIEFFHQFYVNYHIFFSQILEFVRQMEAACVKVDAEEAEQIRTRCDKYMKDLNQRLMDLVHIAQDCPHAEHFITNVCRRVRTSLNMLLHFQMLIGEATTSGSNFPRLLTECRHNLESIIMGSEKGYNLRD